MLITLTFTLCRQKPIQYGRCSLITGAAQLLLDTEIAPKSPSLCQQKPFPVRFSCPRKSCDPYDSVSIDLVTASVGTTDLQASFLPLVNKAGRQQIVTCIVLSLFLNDMATIFYPQVYHSSTIFSTEINQLANETPAGNQFAFNYFYCSFTF